MGLIDYSEIKSIYHVTHIKNSYSIFDSGVINADLVRDKSKLKLNRIKVTWLSPNDWAPGFRYGNVRFEYDFKELIKNKNIYFIETMHTYNPIAHRFLVTNKKYNFQTIEDFSQKNPKHELFFNKNGNMCRKNIDTLEFMLEEDLFLKNCSKIDFVLHHNNQCCIDPYNCGDRGMSGLYAAPFVISHLLASNNFSSDIFDRRYVILSYISLIKKLEKIEFKNLIKTSEEEYEALIESLSLFSERKIDEYVNNISKLVNLERVKLLVKERILKIFNIEITEEDER